jgi:CheY-like chemotaxis protein
VNTHSCEYFDAIILDINMPIMDGFEAITIINRFYTEIQINAKNNNTLIFPNPLIYALTAEESQEMNNIIS